MPARRKSLVGRNFTRLDVFADGPSHLSPSGQRHSQSWCWCRCGNPEPLLVRNGSLTSGNTKSCGCLREEVLEETNVQHGQSRRREHSGAYRSWGDMVQRCTNHNCRYFYNYGGRGLLICQGLRIFANFFAVLGERPPGLEVDRWPNNETGHYSCGECLECLHRDWPLNVRWATHTQNGRNRRTNWIITVRGMTDCFAALCEHFGVPYQKTYQRIYKGWDVDLAFFTP